MELFITAVCLAVLSLVPKRAWASPEEAEDEEAEQDGQEEGDDEEQDADEEGQDGKPQKPKRTPKPDPEFARMRIENKKLRDELAADRKANQEFRERLTGAAGTRKTETEEDNPFDPVLQEAEYKKWDRDARKRETQEAEQRAEARAARIAQAEVQADRRRESLETAEVGFLKKHPEFAGDDGKWSDEWFETIKGLVLANKPTGTVSTEDLERFMRLDDRAHAILTTKNARRDQDRVIRSVAGEPGRRTRGSSKPGGTGSVEDLVAEAKGFLEDDDRAGHLRFLNSIKDMSKREAVMQRLVTGR